MDSARTAILEVSDLNVIIDGRAIIENVNFSVHQGEVMAIVGPNGAGKSTLFRALLGLIPLARPNGRSGGFQGQITWARDVKIGYVPQKMALERDLPLTVREFLQLKSKDYKAVLKEVGIHEHILDHSLGVISGGELQRVLIAWALLGNPDVLLFDEPTAGIDVAGEETIYQLLKKLQGSYELTVLLISHDMNVVSQYTDNLLCLDKAMLCFGETQEMLHTQKFFQHPHHEH